MSRRWYIWGLALAALVAARVAPSWLAPEPTPPWTWAEPPGCVTTPRQNEDWQPSTPKADRFQDATYRCDSHLVSVHVAQYFRQEPGKEAVGGENRISAQAMQGRLTTSTEASGIGFDVNVYRYDSALGNEITVWQWYGIGRNPMASPWRAKLLEAGHLAMFDPQPASQFLLAAVGPAAGATPMLRQTAGLVWSAYLETAP